MRETKERVYRDALERGCMRETKGRVCRGAFIRCRES